MKIAVMGAGAIGGYIGARLAAAGADVDVVLLATKLYDVESAAAAIAPIGHAAGIGVLKPHAKGAG